jgi:hypothetical protein
MAITQWVNNTPGTPLYVAVAPSANNLLIAYAITDSSGSTVDLPTDNLSGTWAQIGTTQTTTYDSSMLAVWWKWAAGGETSIALRMGNDSIGGVIAVSDVDLDTWFDVTAVVSSNSAGSEDFDQNITPYTNGAIILCIRDADGASGNATFSFSTTSGTTGSWSVLSDQNSGFYNVGVGTAEQATAEAITVRSSTTGYTGGRAAALIVLRPSNAAIQIPLSESVSGDESVGIAPTTYTLPLNDSVAEDESVFGGLVKQWAQTGWTQSGWIQNDTQSGGQTYQASVSESHTVAESTATQSTDNIVVGESETVAESAGTVDTATQGVAEAVAGAESVAGAETANAALGDATAVGESGDATETASAAVADSHAAGEDAAAQRTVPVAISESGGVAEAAAGTGTANAGITDSHAVAEQVVPTLTGTIPLTDAISALESALANGIPIVQAAESLQLDDGATAGLVFAAVLSEAVSHGDGLGTILAALSDLIDSHASSDGISTGGATTYDIQLADGSTLSESGQAGLRYLAEFQDSAAFEEAFGSAVKFAPGVAEAHGLTEEQTARVLATLQAAESLLAQEVVTGGLQYAVSVLEEVSHAGELVTRAQANPTLAEAAGVTDAIGTYQAATQALEDAIASVEAGSGGKVVGLELTEAMELAGAIAAAQAAVARLRETLGYDAAVSLPGPRMPEIRNWSRACVVRAVAPRACVVRAVAPRACVVRPNA